MREIHNLDGYIKEFTGGPAKDDVRKEAYKYALEIRKFEISLYWERAKYFWALILAAFGTYFALWTANNRAPGLIFLVTCIGFILSLAWFLVNRGSKYWQENWESHVDVLEDEISGPLYKTTKSDDEFKWYNPYNGFPYSVSKINQIVSLFVVFVWLGLATRTILVTYVENKLSLCFYVLAGIFTIVFTILLLCCDGGSKGKSRRINFKVSELEATK